MILQPVALVREPPTYLPCRCCGEWVKDTEAFADLCGEPFQNYYCKACAKEVECNTSTPE